MSLRLEAQGTRIEAKALGQSLRPKLEAKALGQDLRPRLVAKAENT